MDLLYENKSEVPHLFSCFKAQAKNLLSTKIKTLCTDGGTEYMSITKQYPHIIHQTTCSYTPDQNVLAERKHRHIIELALAIMSHSSLPPLFWDEIYSSVVYLINRLPSHSNSAKIPYTQLFNKDPDYSLLRIIGCQCFSYTHPYISHKLENRALPCLFLGYATTQKGCPCLHIPTNKIYISLHVLFDENYFPFKHLLNTDSASDSQLPNTTLFLFSPSVQQQTSTLSPILPNSAKNSPPTSNPLQPHAPPLPTPDPLQPEASHPLQTEPN